jgi:uncharacterized protein
MRVTQIWRYPVKSLQGERLDESGVDAHGLVGDRRWALFDPALGEGLTARRVPELLFASARLVGDEVVIRLPDGSESGDAAGLSAWLGRDVELRSAAETRSPLTYTCPLVVDDDDAESEWMSWEGPLDAFHDSTRAQISLCSEATLAAFAPVDELRRFRFNVLLDGADGEEDGLLGVSAALGTVDLDVSAQIPRCVMVTRPQPGGIERDTTVLKRLNRERDSCLGVGALVANPGRIAVGDELTPS